MTILDTTVRDGSYAVDFKFSCNDVQDLVGKSERIGIEYIEIGHGLGLNASGPGHGISLQTDVEYMRAARQTAISLLRRCRNPGHQRMKVRDKKIEKYCLFLF